MSRLHLDTIALSHNIYARLFEQLSGVIDVELWGGDSEVATSRTVFCERTPDGRIDHDATRAAAYAYVAANAAAIAADLEG